MITNNEIKAVQLSATKKDYYQIWNELLDLASKISERWDPTSTNESDPGIVLLKVLTALGDKLNYTIDANMLEAYMPSAAQTESMRKLCEMLGYNIKYYESATTDVTISYIGEKELKNTNLEIPMFTSISNIDNTVNYVTLEPRIINASFLTQNIKCMEGQVVRCETNNNNIVTINLLDDNNRYYLPENYIAENGIFIYRVNDGIKSDRWKKVNNLNTQSFNSLVYKFGFDSKENRPYIQFPEDIGQIIEDGLEIYYVRTSGINGNISAKVLSKFEKPSLDSWEGYSVDDFKVANYSATANGHNIETINQAYNSYKKTVGTFNTLVTCRDYMNYIYNLMNSSNVHVVSNIIATDIRNEINRSITLCTFDNYGINYISSPLADADDNKLISNFDLILYPFKKVSGLNTKQEYINSFKLDTDGSTHREIENSLASVKNIAHNIKYPDETEIACIKNYLKLNAKITTTFKVNVVEEHAIIESVKRAIYSKFNSHNLDFGEEIPFDAILNCIETADARIKNVSLDEPTLYTKFEMANGKEIDTASCFANVSNGLPLTLVTQYPGREIYNKLALRNIMAGKVSIFNYDRNFSTEFSEKKYKNLNLIYPIDNSKKIIAIEPSCKFNTAGVIELAKNEIIKFRAPNLTTVATYPAYVNYFVKLNNTGSDEAAQAASFKTLKDTLKDKCKYKGQTDNKPEEIGKIISEKSANLLSLFRKITINSQAEFKKAQDNFGYIYTKDETSLNYSVAVEFVSSKAYYCLQVTEANFVEWYKLFTETLYMPNSGTKNYNGIFRSLGYSLDRSLGYLVDANYVKYQYCTSWRPVTPEDSLNYFYIQNDNDGEKNNYGLGKNAIISGIAKNTEYQLKENEYLAINYMPSASEDQPNAEVNPINILYKTGDIIKPNFDLKDSETVASNNIKYSKITGYSFKEYLNGKELPGMFSFGPNEKVEIRKNVEVKLDEQFTYLYWTLKDVKNANGAIGTYGSYILQDGEYLYYTDANKTAMAYYGSGSEIVASQSDKFRFMEETEATSNKVTAEDILDKGLDIVPWKRYTFNDSNYITIKEYQYITLSEHDKLLSAEIKEDITGKSLTEINKTWQKVNKASYEINGESTQNLPALNVSNNSWEVRSFLALDVGPTKAQTLSENDKLILCYDDNSIDTFSTEKISFKTNYRCQALTDKLDTNLEKLLKDTNIENNTKFKVKIFELDQIGIVDKNGIIDPSRLFIHNFGTQWTHFNFEAFNENDSYLKLNATIDANNFGLLMINYDGIDDNDSGCRIEAKPISIYNYKNTWWTGYKEGYLRKGLNIIRIDSSCELKIHPDKNHEAQLIFSDLDSIYKDNSINFKLLGYLDASTVKWNKLSYEAAIDRLNTYLRIPTNVTSDNGIISIKESDIIKGSDLEKLSKDYTWYCIAESTSSKPSLETLLLKDIAKLDPEFNFYYNCPVNNSFALNINNKLLGTSDAESLADPYILYDSNNANNKFVISEIDADYLDLGIDITRSSKKY